MYKAARSPERRIMVIDQALRANRWPNTKTLAKELVLRSDHRKGIEAEVQHAWPPFRGFPMVHPGF